MQLFSPQILESDLLKLTDVAPFLECLNVTENANQKLRFVNVCIELCNKLSQLQFLSWEESDKVGFIFSFSKNMLHASF